LAQPLVKIKEFEQFFNEYYIPVLRYCCTIVKDMDEAEDIVQQVFISIWQKKETINIHTSARAYLYKTVYNASLDFLKHEGVKEKYKKEIIANNIQPVRFERMQEYELNLKIEMAIAKLPEQCRKIFRMSRIENKKYKEIAAEFNISEKTVENHMGKALKLLRESLKELLPIFLIIITLSK